MQKQRNAASLRNPTRIKTALEQKHAAGEGSKGHNKLPIVNMSMHCFFSVLCTEETCNIK
jgi:hypothetical protein